MIYEIWQEGFMIQGIDFAAKAEFIANVKAESFQEACDKHYKGNPLYNSEHRAVWGCRLYETEEEARQSFG